MKNDFFDEQPVTPRGPQVTIVSADQPLKAALPKPPSTGKRLLKGFLVFLVMAILLIGGFAVVRATDITSKIFVGEKTSFYSKLKNLVLTATGRDARLIGENDGQINILVLGIGGAGHDGGYLSDTIILAQIRPEEKKASLVSIPRDYLADLGPSLGQRKINAAFAEGYDKNKDFNDGGKAAIAAVEKLSGLEIPYFAVIDFAGFKEAIDVIGGVEITVDRTFTDSTYPDGNEGYLAPVTFKAGPEHMNGSRALIFARSRHGNNNEGSDFARSVRQRKVIQATKDKVTNLNFITDSRKLNELLTVLGNHFHTNIQLDEMLHLYGMSKEFNSDSLMSSNLDPSTKLICPQILESNGAYVLSPCPGKKQSDIQNFFKNSFSADLNKLPVVWLADSTQKAANYSSAERELTNLGYTVYRIEYTDNALSNTVFYQANQKPDAATEIKTELNAREASLPPPGVKIDKSKVDIIVILGSDYVPPKIQVPATQTTPKPATSTQSTTPPTVDPETFERDTL